MSAVSLLVDVTTMRIFVATTESGSVNLLHSSDGDTLNPVVSDRWQVEGAKNGCETLKALMATKPAGEWCHYYLDGKRSRVVYSLERPPLTQELRDRTALFQRKFSILSSISSSINSTRRKLIMPALYDDKVRGIKKEQALEFRRSGYDPEALKDCIFVWQYAEVHQISLREAADRLILEGEFFEAELWKSEGIKMRYWNRVLGIRTLPECDGVLEDFQREFYVNALV